MNIKIDVLDGGILPKYETEGAAGADCYAHINESIILQPGERSKIPLGFRVEIPEGYEMQIRVRSGNAIKHGIGEVNGVGTIDSDYRGEVSVIVINHSFIDFEIKPGDRIAQAVIGPVVKAEWTITKELSETFRGSNGFGSTGK